jgi:hypothetical protein
MPLSSSSVDRRTPEALSTSGKRNRIVEGQHLPDAGAGVAAHLMLRLDHARRPVLGWRFGKPTKGSSTTTASAALGPNTAHAHCFADAVRNEPRGLEGAAKGTVKLVFC